MEGEGCPDNKNEQLIVYLSWYYWIHCCIFMTEKHFSLKGSANINVKSTGTGLFCLGI